MLVLLNNIECNVLNKIIGQLKAKIIGHYIALANNYKANVSGYIITTFSKNGNNCNRPESIHLVAISSRVEAMERCPSGSWCRSRNLQRYVNLGNISLKSGILDDSR